METRWQWINFHFSQFSLISQIHKNVVLIGEEQLSVSPQTVGLAPCLGAGFVSGCPAGGLASPSVRWLFLQGRVLPFSLEQISESLEQTLESTLWKAWALNVWALCQWKPPLVS